VHWLTLEDLRLSMTSSKLMEVKKMALVQRTLPKLLISIFMFIIILDYFVLWDPLRLITNTLSKWSTIVIAVSIGMALINVLMVQGKRITRYAKKEGSTWKDASTAVILLTVMIVTMIAGFITRPFGVGAIFAWLTAQLYIPLDLTTFPLLGFYYFSALYRGWKVRSWDMVFMIVPGMIFALSLTPIWMNWAPIIYLKSILNTWHYTPSWTAINLIAYVGILAVSLRTLLGREEAYLGLER